MVKWIGGDWGPPGGVGFGDGVAEGEQFAHTRGESHFLKAARRRHRLPDADVYTFRVGFPAAYLSYGRQQKCGNDWRQLIPFVRRQRQSGL